MTGPNDAIERPGLALDNFLDAACQAGEAGLEEALFRDLAGAITRAVVEAASVAPSSEKRVLERIVDLASEHTKNTVTRDEVQRLAGRLMADLKPPIQADFIGLCLERMNQDLLGDRNTRTWRPVAYLLAANYSLIKSRELRRQFIEMLRSLTKENPGYKKDFFLEDLLLIHDRMRLERLEELKEKLESDQSGEKKT